jgi:broad specificity phosphatase PhoE
MVAARRLWKEEPHAFTLSGGFEPVNDLWTRAGRTWRVMRSDPATAAGADGVTLVVAHNAINQALLCTALGVGVQTGFRALTWPNW